MKLLIMSLCLLFNFTISAEEQAATSADRPCAEDIKKFCPGVEKGEKRIAKCLKEHEKELSPACIAKKEARKEKRKEKMKGIRENCKEDMETLCKDVPVGKGAKIKCLKEKKDQASDKCKAVLQ